MTNDTQDLTAEPLGRLESEFLCQARPLGIFTLKEATPSLGPAQAKHARTFTDRLGRKGWISGGSSLVSLRRSSSRLGHHAHSKSTNSFEIAMVPCGYGRFSFSTRIWREVLDGRIVRFTGPEGRLRPISLGFSLVIAAPDEPCTFGFLQKMGIAGTARSLVGPLRPASSSALSRTTLRGSPERG